MEFIGFNNIRNNSSFSTVPDQNARQSSRYWPKYFMSWYFFSLTIRSYLYQKQLNQHTTKSLVRLLLFHLIESDFVNQVWNYWISNKLQGLLFYNQSMVFYFLLSLRHSNSSNTSDIIDARVHVHNIKRN